MSYRLLVVFFMISLQSIVSAQSKYDNTAKYIEINGTHEQYSNALEQLFTLLEGQYKGRNVSDDTWIQVKGLKKQALKDIKNRLVPAYESYFTEGDINKMYAFYQTDAGKQMAKDRTQLSKKQLKQVTSFYETEVGQKIQSNAEALGQTISDISQEWSHLLFVEAKNILE